MGQLSNGAIIVIVIVCCGGLVCCLGAMGWVYRRRGNEEERGVDFGWRPTNPQGDYMREVRQANQKGLFHVARYHDRSASSLESPSRFASRSDLQSTGRTEPLSPV